MIPEDLIDFTWTRCVDGYRLTKSKPRHDRPPTVGIESAGDRFEAYRPFEKDPALHMVFGRDMKATPEGILKFCNRWGMPGGGRFDVPKGRGGLPTRTWSSMSELLAVQAAMRHGLNLYEKGEYSDFVTLFNTIYGAAWTRMELRFGPPNSSLRWVLVPPDLIRAMWIMFAYYVSSAAELVRCGNCERPVLVGTATGRRNTRKYCSPACKQAAWKRQKQVADREP
jgi:hypothetical protein